MRQELGKNGAKDGGENGVHGMPRQQRSHMSSKLLSIMVGMTETREERKDGYKVVQTVQFETSVRSFFFFSSRKKFFACVVLKDNPNFRGD